MEGMCGQVANYSLHTMKCVVEPLPIKDSPRNNLGIHSLDWLTFESKYNHKKFIFIDQQKHHSESFTLREEAESL